MINYHASLALLSSENLTLTSAHFSPASTTYLWAPPFLEVLFNRFSRKLYNAKIGIHSSLFRGTEISTLPLIPFPFSLGGPSAEVLKSTGIPFRFFRSPVSPELLPFSRYGNFFGKNFRFFISLDFFLFFGLFHFLDFFIFWNFFGLHGRLPI